MRASRAIGAATVALVGCALGVGIALCGGCHGELIELPAAVEDSSIAMDAGTSDSGGGTVTFVSSIERDLDSLGCSGGGACHGSGLVPLHLIANAADAASLQSNYAQIKPLASSDAMSLMLVKALMGSGTPHAGKQPFASVMDPTYQRWLAWIRAGSPFATDGGSP